MSKRVLAIGDLHLPQVRPGYLAFCRDLYRAHRCDTVIFMGDIVDLHAISYYEKHPDADGPSQEILKAKAAVKEWTKAFPNAKVCIGNHDRLLIRKAATGSIPELVLRSFSEIWNTPKWNWVNSVTVDDVLYVHGDGCGGGTSPAYNTMRKLAQSCVMGHFHTQAGLKFLCNSEKRLFGLDVGCGIAGDRIQFLYADRNPCRPILAAGVVLGGMPQLHLMPCSKGERYWDKNFK